MPRKNKKKNIQKKYVSPTREGHPNTSWWRNMSSHTEIIANTKKPDRIGR